MRSLKIKLLNIKNKLIVLTLTFIGFMASCGQSGSKYGPPPNIAEYGAPHAKFILRGRVFSENSNKQIPNIRILMESDTTYTDFEGKFTIDKIALPNDFKMKILIDDPDGKINGKFKPLEIEIDYKDVPLTGGDNHWDIGEAIKEINIKLSPE